jgi:hypothetical protein
LYAALDVPIDRVRERQATSNTLSSNRHIVPGNHPCRLDEQNSEQTEQKIKQQQRAIMQLHQEVSGIKSDCTCMEQERTSHILKDLTIFQRLKEYAPGVGKWKRISFELFSLK